MKTVKQVNNLRICYHKDFAPGRDYVVKTPTGRIWEEFATLQAAEAFCRDTKDFVRKQ